MLGPVGPMFPVLAKSTTSSSLFAGRDPLAYVTASSVQPALSVKDVRAKIAYVEVEFTLLLKIMLPLVVGVPSSHESI